MSNLKQTASPKCNNATAPTEVRKKTLIVQNVTGSCLDGHVPCLMATDHCKNGAAANAPLVTPKTKKRLTTGTGLTTTNKLRPGNEPSEVLRTTGTMCRLNPWPQVSSSLMVNTEKQPRGGWQMHAWSNSESFDQPETSTPAKKFCAKTPRGSALGGRQ